MLTEMGIFLTEEYYGSNPLLDRGDVLLETMRLNVKKNKFYLPNGSPENRELENIFVELFGCGSVQLIWERYGAPNAMTLPVSFVLSKDRLNTTYYKPVKGKYGPKYPNKPAIIISVGVDLFDIGKLTAREVMAVILHEFGHNFQHMTSYNAILGTSTSIGKNTAILLYLLITMFTMDKNGVGEFGKTLKLNVQLTPMYRDLTKYLSKTAHKNKEISDTINSILSAKGWFSSVYSRFSLFRTIGLLLINPNIYGIALVKSIGNIPMQYLNPLANNFMGLGYKNEKFSDIFASKYGYGRDFIAAIGKLNNFSMLNIEPTGTIALLGSLYLLPLSIVQTFAAVHPDSNVRIRNTINYLESEVKNNKDLTPSNKREILSSLDESKDAIDDITVKQMKISVDNNLYKFYIGYINHLSLKVVKTDMKELILGGKDSDYDLFR